VDCLAIRIAFVAHGRGRIYTQSCEGDRMHLSSRKFLFPMFIGAALLLGGCRHETSSGTSSAPDSLPASDRLAISDQVDQTKLVAQGVNKQLSYKVPKLGQIILFDQTTGQFLYHGTVSSGEMFVFEPASSRATINKQTVDLDHVTNERDEYRLYYVPR
jgi:hypothetical protein